MVSMDELKRAFWFLFGVLGVVFFWTGVWDGIGNLWYLENPLVSLLVGIFLLGISKFILRGADPFWGGEENKVIRAVQKVKRHKKNHEFDIKFKDKTKHRTQSIKASKLKDIEKGFMVLVEEGKEMFIPVHKVKEITRNGKTHWKR
ncbi:MAG: RNA repair domain-containing protein [archaeon]|nr:RNA repair domain-containing protein [archaeon]